MKKIIIFGAGKRGSEVLEKYGRESVEFFCDNSPSKWGTTIDGIPVKSFDEMISVYNPEKHIVIVSPDSFAIITGMLEYAGIDEYLIYNIKGSYNHINSLKALESENEEHNAVLERYAERSRRFDLLRDTDEFKNIVSEVIEENKKGMPLFYFGAGEEGNYYGNLDALLSYAGYEEYDKIFAPNVSHNAGVPLRTTETMYKSAVVFSGKYYKEKIHRWRPYVPVFSVGPYIQYAKGIYSAEKINEIKRMNGKTLTVFLPHSIENINRNYRKEDFVDDILKKYSSEFDTILLSVYWADMLEPVCGYAEKKGMKLVTSGFRFDRLFIRRLRSLFELTDAVSGGDFGTHLNYAYHFGIKASRIDISDNQTIHDTEFGGDIEKRIQFNKHYQNYRRGFFTNYDSSFRYDEAQGEWLKPYSGYGITRSPEYIRSVFDISKDILLECGGELSDYDNAVRRTLKKYKLSSDLDKISMLTAATGSFLHE